MCNSCGSGIHFLGDHVLKKLNFSSLKTPNQEHDQPQPPPKDESKDADTTIFSGGSILTMENGAFSPKDALVMRGETIQFTGSVQDAINEYGDGATRYDLAGKCLLPGFIDPHVHITLTSLANYYFSDLSATKVSKLRDAVKIITDALAEGKPKNGWVVGFGYDPSRVIDNPDLTKQILDGIPNSQGVPIFVLNQSGHIAYVNSKALEEALIDKSAPPPGFQRDKKGELTGVIFEEEAIGKVAFEIPPPDPAEVEKWVADTFDKFARQGCTTIYEVQLGAFGEGEIDLIKGASEVSKNVPVNLYGAYSEKILAAQPDLKPETLEGIHMQGIKFVTDGSTQGYSAAVTEKYLQQPAGTEEYGILNYKNNTQALKDGMRASVEAGFQIVVHANGDDAIDQTLDAYDAIKGLGLYPGMHRIDHFTVNRPEQILRVKQLELSLSHTINHIRWWGQVFVEDIIGLNRARRIVPLKSDFDLGITVSMHSDSPVTEVHPLSYLRTAVTRFMGDTHTPLGEEEIIPLEKALTCITLNPAKQLGIDHITGTLEVGKNADMVMLDSDPQNIPPSLLDKLTVEATWVKGKQAYRA